MSGGENHEQIAERAYLYWSGNDPRMHCNRFPAWSELSEGERDRWRGVVRAALSKAAS